MPICLQLRVLRRLSISLALGIWPILLVCRTLVRIKKDSWGHSYLYVRGEILGFIKDEITANVAAKAQWSHLFDLIWAQGCNNKLLALCGAGMLSSVATLIHDTYLPLYLQDVLGMSNTKVTPSYCSGPSCAYMPDSVIVSRPACHYTQAPKIGKFCKATQMSDHPVSASAYA